MNELKSNVLLEGLKSNIKSIIGVTLLLLVFILKESISETTTYIDFLYDFVIIIVIISAYFIQLLLMKNSINEKFDSLFDKKHNDFEKLIGKYESKLAQHSEWFFSHERLAGIEKEYCTNKMDNIWIASSNLDYEKENSPFINAIKNNLKEGISYHYIVPKKQLRLLKIRVKALQDFAKTTKGNISFIPVDDESLFLFLSNIVIYKDKTTDYPEAYKELIIDNELMKRAWMKVNENNSDFGELYSKFEEYVNKN